MRSIVLSISLVLTLTASAQLTDSFNVSATGGKSLKTWHGQASIAALNLELDRAVSPRTVLGFVISPMTVRQPRSWFGDEFGDGDENVQALAASLLARRYFHTRSSHVQLFGEVSTGPMWAERRVPASTSRFNFVSQAGAGFLIMPNSAMPLMIGYRYMHISNGGYAPRNPGLNVSSLMIGTMIRTRPARR